MSTPYIGEIRIFAGTFAPTGWAHCDGEPLTVDQNPALFSLIGTTFGGDGRTTFSLPDMRGRIPIHQGSGPGLTTRHMGEAGGSEKVELTINTLARHNHPFHGTSETQNISSPEGTVLAANSELLPYSPNLPDTELSESALTTSTGPNSGHANMMPFQVLNYIIALTGAYPSQS